MAELKTYKFLGIDEVWQDANLGNDYYLKSEADKVIAEKDKEIAELKDKLQNVSEILKETREWLMESQKLHKRCADNAVKVLAEKDKEIRRLHRALYKACANWASGEVVYRCAIDNPFALWSKMESKCLKKAEEYK